MLSKMIKKGPPKRQQKGTQDSHTRTDQKRQPKESQKAAKSTKKAAKSNRKHQKAAKSSKRHQQTAKSNNTQQNSTTKQHK